METALDRDNNHVVCPNNQSAAAGRIALVICRWAPPRKRSAWQNSIILGCREKQSTQRCPKLRDHRSSGKWNPLCTDNRSRTLDSAICIETNPSHDLLAFSLNYSEIGTERRYLDCIRFRSMDKLDFCLIPFISLPTIVVTTSSMAIFLVPTPANPHDAQIPWHF